MEFFVGFFLLDSCRKDQQAKIERAEEEKIPNNKKSLETFSASAVIDFGGEKRVFLFSRLWRELLPVVWRYPEINIQPTVVWTCSRFIWDSFDFKEQIEEFCFIAQIVFRLISLSMLNKFIFINIFKVYLILCRQHFPKMKRKKLINNVDTQIGPQPILNLNVSILLSKSWNLGFCDNNNE